MAKYLVDANVLSEPTKTLPSAAVIRWLAQHELELVVNPIILGELEYGILQMPAGRRRTKYLDWLARGTAHLEVLPIDQATSSIWAQLLADLKRKGRAMPVKDSLIAATAIQHDLLIATRNIADYQHSGARLINPFDA